MTDRPAFYALAPGGLRDYWTLLHPPYTAWHLAFVAIGASVADPIDPGLLGLALLGFFLGVGVAAHALDELHGRPLRTRIPDGVLIGLAIAGLAGAIVLAIYGAWLVSWWGLAYIVVGGFLMPAYNLEWFGGRFHSDLWFAVMWGGFPASLGAFAQTGRVEVAATFVAIGCALVAVAQRRLSTPVRRLRRHAVEVGGTITLDDGTVEGIDAATLRSPSEGALRMMWMATVALAVGLTVARWP